MKTALQDESLQNLTQPERVIYAKAWADYLKRRNLLTVVFVGYMPWGMLVFSISRPLHFPEMLTSALIVAWFLAFPVSAIRLSSWSCPRCGNWFFAKWWYHNSFARKCVHCRLPKKWLKENYEEQLKHGF